MTIRLYNNMKTQKPENVVNFFITWNLLSQDMALGLMAVPENKTWHWV